MARKDVVRADVVRSDMPRREPTRVTLGDRANPIRKDFAPITQETISEALDRFKQKAGIVTKLPAEVSKHDPGVRLLNTFGADAGRRYITLDK